MPTGRSSASWPTLSDASSICRGAGHGRNRRDGFGSASAQSCPYHFRHAQPNTCNGAARGSLAVQPIVSIVVPTLTGRADGALESVRDQTFDSVEVEVVSGVKPAGRARNLGARSSRATYLLFLDDDARLGDRSTLERLVAALESHQ